MSTTEMEGTKKNGHFIALEGDTNVISTQLRLLPPSQKILILPDLFESQTTAVEDDTFNARTFVQSLQTAFSLRLEKARSFLESASSTQPRLVLAVHGSVSARATCITKISQNITSGDASAAEVIFNELVKDGVAGLMKTNVVEAIDIQVNKEIGNGQDSEPKEAPEATGSRSYVMEANFPQTPSSTSFALHRSPSRLPSPPLSLRLGAVAQNRASSSNLNMDASMADGDSPIVETVLTIPSRRKASPVDRRSTSGLSLDDGKMPGQSVQESSSQVEDTDTDAEEEFYTAKRSPAGSISSLPMSRTTSAMYGEAYLVEVPQTARPTTFQNPQSIDGFRPFWLDPSKPRAQSLKQTKSQYHLRERPHSAAPSLMGLKERGRFPTLPQAAVGKFSDTTIRKSPITPRVTTSYQSSGPETEMADHATYVHQGTDAEEAPCKKSEEISFVPVFELVEDMVIHFTDDASDEIFDSVVQSYKTGSYLASSLVPAVPKSPAFTLLTAEGDNYESSVKAMSISNEPQVESDAQPEVRPTSYMTSMSVKIGYDLSQQEYDPFSVNDNTYPSYPSDIKRPWPLNAHLKISPNPETSSLAETSSSPLTILPLSPTKEVDEAIAEKFVEFSPPDMNDAISVQNSFRQLLNVYFPPDQNYRQYYYPVAPEADRFWKPVFRNEENSSIGNEGRTVDQIIAFGSEEGVKRDLFYQVSGQIERLGAKRDGLNRSGKVDIRYLISSVMQNISEAPTAEQSSGAFSDPEVLAALLVPHIEAFLANNASTRLLILHYNAPDLPIIFALRNILGSDLFKISGIMDSLASEPTSLSRTSTSSSRPRTPTSAFRRPSVDTISRQVPPRLNSVKTFQHQASNSASLIKYSSQSTLVNTPTTPQSRARSASFAKADYLLPSTATDSEATSFLSNIWKALMEKSAFYTPEPEPKPILIERPPIPPTPFSPMPPITCDPNRDSGYQASNYTGSRCKISRLTGSGVITSPVSRSHSFASTIRGTSGSINKYEASIASAKTSASERERRGDKEWDNFYIGEDDSDDDEYDKMILGRSHQRIVPEVKRIGQKRNTKKALKWLGLA